MRGGNWELVIHYNENECRIRNLTFKPVKNPSKWLLSLSLRSYRNVKYIFEELLKLLSSQRSCL